MMINNVTFTGAQKGMQDLMTAAAHEYLPVDKIFSKAEVEVAEQADKAVKVARQSVEEINNALFFNHRCENVESKALANLEAAASYAASHGNPADAEIIAKCVR